MRGPSSGPRAKHAMSHHPCQIKMQLGRSDWSLRLLAETPQLKPLRIDCFFDRIAREVMGSSAVWADRAGDGPGTMVLRKSAAHEVARESLQAFPRFRLKNVNPHARARHIVDVGGADGGLLLAILEANPHVHG